MAHTFINIVNGYKIRHWGLGDIYYISDGLNWSFEHKSLQVVEKHARTLLKTKTK